MKTPTLPAVAVFGIFAFTYLFSALLRAVTATLAPVFSRELGLQAADLGLLAGAYFFGFAATQLPLGGALDRYGPRRTLMVLLAVAVLGCIAFALAPNLPAMIAARVLIGVGVGACLMAPLTCYRTLFTSSAQLRANSWMLMTGSLGMVASTLPVQWLLPTLGWRGLFWAIAAVLLVSTGLVAWGAPRVLASTAAGSAVGSGTQDAAALGHGGYLAIARHPLFMRLAPLGFWVYGGLIAVQSLWAGPWLTRVGGATAEQAARGLFTINLAMLCTFMTWGAVMPRLARRGIGALRLVAWGVPLALCLLALNIASGAAAGPWHWAAWCMACSFVAVSQPAIGAAFPVQQVGRALSAFNLVIFSGVFCIQWGIGLVIDGLRHHGIAEPDAMRLAFAAFGLGGVLAYLWFLRVRRVALP
ncbi:MAG: MFS transporter [Rubrivivax sp.]